MFRWLKNRKEKKERKRKEKHRRILNALKLKNTYGSSSDYAIYKDDVMFKCVTENKHQDYEEIDDVSLFPPQFTRIVGSNFTFSTTKYTNDHPPQLPARNNSSTSISLSTSACSDISREKTIWQRTRHDTSVILDSGDDPRDSKSNLIVQRDADNISLGLYEKVNRKIASEENELNSRWNRLTLEDKIYSEIEDSDTGCESDAISKTGSDFSDTARDATNVRGLQIKLQSDESSESDTSCGFYDGYSEIDDERNILLIDNPGNRYHQHPCFNSTSIQGPSFQKMIKIQSRI